MAEIGMSEDVAAVFDFDPFGGEESQGPTIEGDASEVAPEVAPKPETAFDEPAEQPKESKAAPPVEPPSEEDDPGEPDELAVMREQLAALKNELAEAKVPKQQKEAPAPEVEDDTPNYQFSIDDRLLDGLASEDVEDRRNAIVALTSGLARNIHKTVMGAVQSKFGPKFEEIPQQIQQMSQVRETARTVYSDFYGKYPTLQKPDYIPTIQAVSREVMQERKTDKWSAEMRDEIAKRAMQRLGFKPKVAPPPSKPAKGSSPVIFDQGSRPAGGGRKRSTEDEIADTLEL